MILLQFFKIKKKEKSNWMKNRNDVYKTNCNNGEKIHRIRKKNQVWWKLSSRLASVQLYSVKEECIISKESRGYTQKRVVHCRNDKFFDRSCPWRSMASPHADIRWATVQGPSRFPRIKSIVPGPREFFLSIRLHRARSNFNYDDRDTRRVVKRRRIAMEIGHDLAAARLNTAIWIWN